MYSIAKRVASKVVKDAVHVEYKLKDKTMTGAVSTSSTIYRLTEIAQGDTESSRDGMRLTIKGLRWKGNVVADTSAENTIIRMIVFLDRQTDGATPADTDLLEDADTAGLPNRDNRNRFWIMSDKLYSLTTGSRTAFAFDWYKRFKKGITVHYKGSGSAVTDAKENQVFMLLISNQGTYTPYVTSRARMVYTDA